MLLNIGSIWPLFISSVHKHLCFSFRSYLKDGMSTTVFEGQCAVIKYVNPILDGVRAHPILDGGGKKPPVLTLPFSV